MELQKYSSVKRLTTSTMFTPSSTPVIKLHRPVFGFLSFEGFFFFFLVNSNRTVHPL